MRNLQILQHKQESRYRRNIGGRMRTINLSDVTANIKEMCIEANHYLTPDMDEALKKAAWVSRF